MVFKPLSVESESVVETSAFSFISPDFWSDPKNQERIQRARWYISVQLCIVCRVDGDLEESDSRQCADTLQPHLRQIKGKKMVDTFSSSRKFEVVALKT